MLPPSSLICRVTTASPIQTIENTPEKTKSLCALEALMQRNMLNKRQNISGPLRGSVRKTSLQCGAEPTKDPNPSTLHSSRLVIIPPHLASVRPDLWQSSQSLPFRRFLHHSYRYLLVVALRLAGIWAKELVSSSPILPIGLLTRCPKHFRPACSEALFGPRPLWLR